MKSPKQRNRINVQKVRNAVEALKGVLDDLESTPSDVEQARKQYGARLIRVDWQYVDVAFKHPHLKHVCTWSNGDEGFILSAPHDKKNSIS
jgi:hypothetical protein